MFFNQTHDFGQFGGNSESRLGLLHDKRLFCQKDSKFSKPVLNAGPLYRLHKNRQVGFKFFKPFNSNLFTFCYFMELAVADHVVYSLPLDGDRAGTLFTSIGIVSGLSSTHVTLEIPQSCKFPYSSATLPAHHRAASYSPKVEALKEFKLPRLFIRRVISKKTSLDPKVAEGVCTDNGVLGYTMWCGEKRDYVFQILTCVSSPPSPILASFAPLTLLLENS
jgi:hypothetical protein